MKGKLAWMCKGRKDWDTGEYNQEVKVTFMEPCEYEWEEITRVVLIPIEDD